MARSSGFFRRLTFRQKLTYCAHFYKALARQYHQPLSKLLKPYMHSDGIIIEVGGHAGQIIKIFSKAVPEGHVYVFEPGSYAYSILCATKFFKRLSNVSLWKIGVSSHTGEASFHVPLKRSGSIGYGTSYVHGEGEETIEDPYLTEAIQVITLDDFVAREKISSVSLIKVDVEGHEMAVLQGAKNMIETYAPAVFIEVQEESLQRAGSSVEALFSFFDELGYRSLRVDEEDNCLVANHDREKSDYLFYKDRDETVTSTAAVAGLQP